MRIGVLALQGAFAEHISILDSLGVQACEIRSVADWKRGFDGIILPGGESTVMHKLLQATKLLDPLGDAIRAGLPVWGTCAGLILLSKKVDGKEGFFSTMDIESVRNAYGRQLGSFQTEANFAAVEAVPMVFIRAPYIRSFWGKTKGLAYVGERCVAAQDGNQLATAFHPELTGDRAVYRYFLEEMVGGTI